MAKMLIVEDDRELADAAFQHLKQSGHTVQVAYSLADGLRSMERHQPQVVVTDLLLGEASGLDIVAASRTQKALPDVVLVTAHPSAESASDAMELGAYEYICKPYAMDELSALVARILERRELLDQARGRPDRGPAPEAVVAGDAGMIKVLQALDEVAPRDTTVLLRGETGTGKEVLARYIHCHGPHPAGPFVALNCAAIPENLLASELFGHERGAFTGAEARRSGAFERADGGTLLLDEIGDIPAGTQVHLLRVLESREVIRVGGNTAIPVHPRLIAATHRDLEQRVHDGLFREDLYFRIHVYPVDIPPLKERPDDIVLLVRHFLSELEADERLLPPEAVAQFQQYHWPGNVRELRNVVENLVIRAHGKPIAAEQVAGLLRPLQRLGRVGPGHETLAELEIRRIREALATAQGNKSKAAATLGISRRRLYSRMKVLGIEEE